MSVTEHFHRSVRRGAALGALGLLLAPAARASLLSGEALETATDVLSWVVLIALPLGGLYLFWMLHILPEKIAHKRRHPQKDAIEALCLLSLFFGGLLWPLAWLWAHTKPVLHKAAYGTDTHDHHDEPTQPHEAAPPVVVNEPAPTGEGAAAPTLATASAPREA